MFLKSNELTAEGVNKMKQPQSVAQSHHSCSLLCINLYVLMSGSSKIFSSHKVVMCWEICCRNQIVFFIYQPINMFISALKLGILSQDSVAIGLLLRPARKLHFMNLVLLKYLHVSIPDEDRGE